MYMMRLVEVLAPCIVAGVCVFLGWDWYIYVPAALIAYWIVIFAERVLFSMKRKSEELKKPAEELE